MITIKYNGRFGNNLFQYAYARLLAEKYEISLCTDLPDGSLFRNYNNPRGAVSYAEPIRITDSYKWLPYLPELDKSKAYRVDGFFQRPEYYAEHRDKIRGYFDFSPGKTIYDDIAVHVRLTDYHKFGRYGTVISPEWYVNILRSQKFRKATIFTDDPEDKYLACFREFDHEIVRGDAKSDFTRLASYDRIVMSNSSFAWWAGFLGAPSKVWTFGPWLRYCYDSSCTLARFPGTKRVHGRFLKGGVPQKRKVSFVICYRDDSDGVRAGHLRGAIDNIKLIYGDIEKEIIVAQQCDELPFKRGQLFNLGYRESSGEIVVFQDADIRYHRPLNFEVLLDSSEGKASLPFLSVAQVKEDDDSYEVTECRQRDQGFGAVNVFTRQLFEESGGFSNLFEGWGGEDLCMQGRAHFSRQNHLGILHVNHKRDTAGPMSTINGSRQRRNTFLAQTDLNRDQSKDGFRQTTANVSKSIRDGVTYLACSDITVPEDFPYADLMQDKIDVPISSLPAIPIGVMTYERPSYFKYTMDSLIQSGANLAQAWVYDDASKGREKKSLLQYYKSLFQTIVSPDNFGPYRSCCELIETMYVQSQYRYFVLCQDDVEFGRGWMAKAIQIVDAMNRDGLDWGILSLYNRCTKPTDKKYMLMRNGHPGGVCWIVNRFMWQHYRKDNNVHAGTGRLSDFRICHWCQHNDKREWAVAVSPQSLVQHIGDKSTLSDKDMTFCRSPYYIGV